VAVLDERAGSHEPGQARTDDDDVHDPYFVTRRRWNADGARVRRGAGTRSVPC
jgi:hypothetical protein